MGQDNLTGQVHNAMYQQIKKRGYAAPVDVLMDIGVLSKTDYENWRRGRVDYLERVCKMNLHKLSEIMRLMRGYAAKTGLKPSWTFYRQWECKESRKLRFSKSGKAEIEKAYATHFVSQNIKDKPS